MREEARSKQTNRDPMSHEPGIERPNRDRGVMTTTIVTLKRSVVSLKLPRATPKGTET